MSCTCLLILNDFSPPPPPPLESAAVITIRIRKGERRKEGLDLITRRIIRP